MLFYSRKVKVQLKRSIRFINLAFGGDDDENDAKATWFWHDFQLDHFITVRNKVLKGDGNLSTNDKLLLMDVLREATISVFLYGCMEYYALWDSQDKPNRSNGKTGFFFTEQYGEALRYTSQQYGIYSLEEKESVEDSLVRTIKIVSIVFQFAINGLAEKVMNNISTSMLLYTLYPPFSSGRMKLLNDRLRDVTYDEWKAIYTATKMSSTLLNGLYELTRQHRLDQHSELWSIKHNVEESAKYLASFIDF